MHIDILIFAVIAAFLIYRLNSVLGTRNGEERPSKNPFSNTDKENLHLKLVTEDFLQKKPVKELKNFDDIIDLDANKDGKIEEGLDDISEADSLFDPSEFMEGSKYAFGAIVQAYSKGDCDTLKSLLSPKLYAEFESGIKAREDLAHTDETTIHRITDARIIEAHLGGTMAYITVDYDVEQTTITRDNTGKIVEGDVTNTTQVEDIWTFMRDTRSSDPNWTLIETRAIKKT